MYEIIKIHTPAVAHPNHAVEVSTLSTIPSFLWKAITLVDNKLKLDNVNGYRFAPMGSVICYEKSDFTASGYNCWSVGQAGIDLEKVDGIFYTKSRIIHAMLIPDKNEARPLWANSCNLIYNGDGTATLNTENGNVSGRIGIDFLLCHGMKEKGKSNVSILATYDKSYNDYIVCNDSGEDIGKLSDFYPA